ncbi:hypothetical protein [Microcoleus sp. PH2017_13_LAR_U_A]|nr:hypothetical protein [Microcoleus sp. PH2017_13_LAR_U_A]
MGNWGMGNGAWGMGHGAWEWGKQGIGNWAFFVIYSLCPIELK